MMAPGRVPPLKPAKLTPVNVATPSAPVVAEPTFVLVAPFLRVNATSLPGRGEPPKARVAVRLAVPAKVPLPATANRFDCGRGVSVIVACAAVGVGWRLPTLSVATL